MGRINCFGIWIKSPEGFPVLYRKCFQLKINEKSNSERNLFYLLQIYRIGFQETSFLFENFESQIKTEFFGYCWTLF